MSINDPCGWIKEMKHLIENRQKPNQGRLRSSNTNIIQTNNAAPLFPLSDYVLTVTSGISTTAPTIPGLKI